MFIIDKNQPSESLQAVNKVVTIEEQKTSYESTAKTFQLLGKYEKFSIADSNLAYAYIVDESHVTNTALAALGM